MVVKKYYKCTGPNGLAFKDGETRYVPGEVLTLDACDGPEVGVCGRGLHVVEHLVDIRHYVSRDLRQCDFFEVEVRSENIIASDAIKTRVRSLAVLKKLHGVDFGVKRGTLVEIVNYGSGSGYGDGSGDGDGSGYGHGHGHGDGSGDGDGSGYGHGHGHGDGSGDGSGYGYGDGYGSGYGYGYGHGHGHGYGHGYGYGDGSGYGSGSGSGDGSGYGEV